MSKPDYKKNYHDGFSDEEDSKDDIEDMKRAKRDF